MASWRGHLHGCCRSQTPQYLAWGLYPDEAGLNPWQEALEISLPVLEQPDQEGMSFRTNDFHFPPIHAQENIGREESDALVAINKGVVEQQRLELGRRHLIQGLVVAGLRPVERAFQQTPVANAFATPETRDEALMNGQYLVNR